MDQTLKRHHFVSRLLFVFLFAGLPLARPLFAQNPGLQQRIAEFKQSMAANQQALMQYTWREQDTISLKGEEKKQEVFQVRLGPDGKSQKTAVESPDSDNSSGGGRRQGRVKKHVVEKKKEEFKDYADSIKDLIQQYVPPSKERVAQAQQQGNISAGPAGAPGELRLVISNYLKPGDNMTVVINQASGGLQSLSIASYLSDPSDAVQMSVQFETIPNGPNHVAGATVNGVSKQLTIAIQNSDYQKL